MSDYLMERAEELIDDPVISKRIKDKARAYIKAMEAFEAVSEDELSTAQIEQKERDEENVRKARAAGWTDFPKPDTIVEFVDGRHKGQRARVRGYYAGPGCVSVELVDAPTLLCGIPLHRLRMHAEVT